MKKKMKKLSLAKETLRNLSNGEIRSAVGGGPSDACTVACTYQCTCNCTTGTCDACTDIC